MKTRNRPVERVCEVCGAQFSLAAYYARRPGRGRFCSPACANTARRKPERNRQLRASGRKTCVQCGEGFACFPGELLRRKFCSVACKVAAYATKEQRTCEVCGETFEFAPSQLRANPGAARFCSRKCRDDGLVAATARKPQKNLHQARRPDLEWRSAVLERDGHRCRRCGESGNHAHHVAPRTRRPDLRNDLDNGVCLCAKCHGWVHGHPIEAEAAGLLSAGSYEREREVWKW